ncbi:hypothetical protein [Kineothrix sp. MB12-C1]|uniref:hypothetical protein n=1 Tax=Kineothrix sp. MB12-C1 TaxID=3070215 RepID=UPI0027D2D8B3|nr:hypothetical protein [Kineothrix sp. MB12-C1]WMC91219.1 hypothetical protein RBB56_10015 [Kineothrix sp. MB12-C1]
MVSRVARVNKGDREIVIVSNGRQTEVYLDGELYGHKAERVIFDHAAGREANLQIIQGDSGGKPTDLEKFKAWFDFVIDKEETKQESINVHVESNVDEVKREITELRDLLKEANSLLDELASKEDVLKIIATL